MKTLAVFLLVLACISACSADSARYARLAELHLPLSHLVAWYSFDKPGDIIPDAVHPAADAKRGNGVYNIGNPSKLNFRSGFTLCARIKTKDAHFGQIIGADGAGGLVVSLNQIKLASWGADWVVDAYIPENQWVHVAVTIDAQGNGHIYLNGAEIASSKVQLWPKDPDNWTMGGWKVGEYFKGSMDDVMVWDTALSGVEVKQLAASLGLGTPVKTWTDEPAPISETPKSVRKMAEILKPLALEPDLLPRYPFAATMGGKRFDEALRLRTHAQRAREEKWLADLVPTFDCPDEKWVRTWYYRWFVVRANYEEEDGIPGFYEGKRGAYARHITYSAPHIMDEARWLRDGRYAYGQAEILGKRREPNGRRFGGYTHWIAATLWDTYLVHPDTAELQKLLPAWAEDTRTAFMSQAWIDRNGTDRMGAWLLADKPRRDFLLNPPNHWATGMEWQPAWFSFDNYDRSKETNLYRPDYTAYYYANAMAVAQMYRVLGDKYKAADFLTLADLVRLAMTELMWDPATRYFYSVKTGTDEKAMVKEVVGIYPFAFGIPTRAQAGAFDSILDPSEFWGPWKVTSCTMKCPMYTPKVQLCNWNGPVWPHANSLVAQALAQGIRKYGSKSVTPKKIWELLDSYTSLHYEDKGTWKQPNIHEEGNADDGQMYGCPDYFHSTYNDLIITLVGGLVPRNDNTIELYPVVAVPWDHFRLDGIPYKGHTLSIVWDARPDGQRYAKAPKGYSIYADGKLLKTSPRLERMTAELPQP